MVNKISKVFVILFLFSVVTLIFFGNIRGYEVEKNGKIIIAKYVSQRNYPKSQTNFFVYYIDGKKHKDNGGRAPIGFSKNIGKFYKIKYSEKYTHTIYPLFNQEVTDTDSIIQAGFTKEELK